MHIIIFQNKLNVKQRKMAATIMGNAKAGQELSTIPSENYMQKGSIGGPDFPVLEVPVVDFGLLTSSSPEGEKELDKLRLALPLVVNHGIKDSFLDEVHGVSKGFFQLPMEEKMKCARPKDDTDGYRGDTVYSEKQTLYWNDRLYLIVKPESSRKPNVWPENPHNFSDVVMKFTSKMEKMNDTILRAMPKTLKLKDEECFLKQFEGNPIWLSRFNLYPPCPHPDQVLGGAPHTDASGLTLILLQDKNVEGLQTLKDGVWYKVPVIPNAILLNVGDQVEIMSNGIFKSPLHRVVTNPHKERCTTALFRSPDATSEIRPVDGLIDENRPKLYKNVVNYTDNYFQLLLTGKMPLDVARI